MKLAQVRFGASRDYTYLVPDGAEIGDEAIAVSHCNGAKGLIVSLNAGSDGWSGPIQQVRAVRKPATEFTRGPWRLEFTEEPGPWWRLTRHQGQALILHERELELLEQVLRDGLDAGARP